MAVQTLPTDPARAYFHADPDTVCIEQILIADKDVVREARHWTTGLRGPMVDDPDQLASADLTAFVIEARKIGAHALSATGQAQETRALEQIVRELGDRATQSSTTAAEITERSARDAATTVSDATAAAKLAIVEAEAAGRRELGAAIISAKDEMHTELRRLFGGENPELLDRIDPLLQKFSTELDTRVGARVAELFTTAVRQFDLDDPTSPVAKHAAGLERNQAQLAEHLERRHTELTEKFDDLTRELQLRTAEKRATSRSPKKGDLYADDLPTLLTELATGLGDEYIDTSSRTGAVARSKKGDGLLVVAGRAARVVVENRRREHQPRAGRADRYRRHQEDGERDLQERPEDREPGQHDPHRYRAHVDRRVDRSHRRRSDGRRRLNNDLPAGVPGVVVATASNPFGKPIFTAQQFLTWQTAGNRKWAPRTAAWVEGTLIRPTRTAHAAVPQ
jgi:hypothetical protein